MLRVKLGFLCGVLATLLFLIGDAILGSENAIPNARTDPSGFGSYVNSGAFSFWALRGMVGVVLEAVFAVALWHYLSRTALEAIAWWGAIFSIIGDFFGMAFFGIAYFLIPQIGTLIAAGNSAAVELATPPVAVFFGMLVPTLIGLGLSVYAIWRTALLPRWAALLWLFGMLLVPIQIPIVQLLASTLWLAAGVGFVWKIWSDQTLPER